MDLCTLPAFSKNKCSPFQVTVHTDRGFEVCCDNTMASLCAVILMEEGVVSTAIELKSLMRTIGLEKSLHLKQLHKLADIEIDIKKTLVDSNIRQGDFILGEVTDLALQWKRGYHAKDAVTQKLMGNVRTDAYKQGGLDYKMANLEALEREELRDELANKHFKIEEQLSQILETEKKTKEYF